MAVVAPRITLTKVRKALAKDGWRLGSNQAYMNRRASVLGGAVNFAEEKHTGTKTVLVRVTWYTGVPNRRWDSFTTLDLKEAVAVANEKAQGAIDATVKELGEERVREDLEKEAA